MSTTLSLVRQEMLNSHVDELGRVLETPTSITATTAVFDSLKTGGVLAEKYLDKWLVRPDAASVADRLRRITNFDSTTGTQSHAGTAYADTTPGTEVFEVLGFEPRLYDEAINKTLGQTKFLDRTEILALGQGGRHYLSALTWLNQPSQVRRIKRVTGPQLSRNRDFSKWNGYSSGALVPDDWSLSGVGCTWGRGGTYTWRGAPASLSVTPAVAVAAVVSQTVGLAESGVTADTYRGYVVTVTGRIRCTDANNARVWVNDGTGAIYSGYHGGASAFEELSASITIASTATNLTFGMASAANKLVCQVGELWLDYQALTDSGRRYNETEETIWDYRYAGQTGMPLVLPPTGLGGHYAIYSERGYPQIAASRIAGGTADDDVIDAPLMLIATGAIGNLYTALGSSDHSDAPRWRALGQEWMVKYEQMHRLHMLELDANEPGWRPKGRSYGQPSPVFR